MKALTIAPLLIATLTILPALAEAASMADYGLTQGPMPQAYGERTGRSLAQMDLEPRFYLKRAYSDPVAATPPTDQPVTAISRQVALDGPVGSVGLITLSGVRNQTFGDSLAAQRGLPSRALGFNVSYNFH